MYNVVYDDNATTYYVYYDRSFVGFPDTYITHNYWGTSFNPNDHLYPAACFIYNPTWNFGCQKDGTVEGQYDSAVNHVTNEEYDLAEALFKDIIIENSESKYAKASVKQLFSLKDLYDQDYAGLKTFYDTTTVLQDTTEISKLAYWLSNKCDVKRENYQVAVDWYENIIDNPETENDSTFAIIDLGYTYLLMEDSSQRQNIMCKFPQYRFSSRSKYSKYRDKLLDNLFGGESSTSISEHELNVQEQLSSIIISPNPVTNQVNIQFKSNALGNLEISVSDMSGRLILKEDNLNVNEGMNTFSLDLSDHPKGIYNCTFKFNNVLSASKRIIKF